MARYNLRQSGEQVQAAIDKIIALTVATAENDGLMSALDKQKLDDLGILYHETAYWDEHQDFIPGAGVIVVYSDRSSIEKDGQQVLVPGVKIGSGNAYVVDLAFIDANIEQRLTAHINDNGVHVTPELKAFWNRKLNVDDNNEVVGESLILTRN